MARHLRSNDSSRNILQLFSAPLDLHIEITVILMEIHGFLWRQWRVLHHPAGKGKR